MKTDLNCSEQPAATVHRPEQRLTVPQYPIVSRRLLNDENLLLGLAAPELCAAAVPGQFLNLQGNQLLRRPIGIARVERERGIVYVGIRAKGAGTRCFFDLACGQSLSVLGPLGHGFELEGVKRAFIVGGGTGLFPLLFLCEELRKRGVEIHLAGGFRSVEQAFWLDEFRGLAHCCFASELGGLDVTGYAQDALEKLWADAGAPAESHLFACGPTPLMRAAALWAESLGLAAQVSLEERMACGIGVCRTCATELKNPSPDGAQPHYARCCMEGPVFPAEEVKWPL